MFEKRVEDTMNANDIRQLYEYHFTVNRRIWDRCIAGLVDEQFTRAYGYSIGSVRDQTVHMMSVDDRWFSGLRGEALPDFLDPVAHPDPASVRVFWDAVEGRMREYLDKLVDDDLQADYEGLKVWQVLVHVVNHGTDHRAQLLALLNQQFGVETFPQDFIFYVWGMDPSQPRSE
jgi:uncharacterized damage-inducible protein DinB